MLFKSTYMNKNFKLSTTDIRKRKENNKMKLHS